MAQLVKNLPAMWEIRVRPLGWKDPLEKERLPILVFLPREFRELYSPWGGKESDTTERLSLSLWKQDLTSYCSISLLLDDSKIL